MSLNSKNLNLESSSSINTTSFAHADLEFIMIRSMGFCFTTGSYFSLVMRPTDTLNFSLCVHHSQCVAQFNCFWIHQLDPRLVPNTPNMICNPKTLLFYKDPVYWSLWDTGCNRFRKSGGMLSSLIDVSVISTLVTQHSSCFSSRYDPL